MKTIKTTYKIGGGRYDRYFDILIQNNASIPLFTEIFILHACPKPTQNSITQNIR